MGGSRAIRRRPGSRRRRGAVALSVALAVCLAAAPSGAGLLRNAVGAYPAGLAADSTDRNLVGGLTDALDRAMRGALSDDPAEADAAFDDAKRAVGKTARDMIPGAALLDLFDKRLQTARTRIRSFLGDSRAALALDRARDEDLFGDLLTVPLPKANLRAALLPAAAAAPPDPWGPVAAADPWADDDAGGAGAVRADPWGAPAPAVPAAPTVAQAPEEPPPPVGAARDRRYALAAGGAETSYDDALEGLRRREIEARRAAEAEERRAAEAEERRAAEHAEAERRREAEARRERERVAARNREIEADNWRMFIEGVGNALNTFNQVQQQQVDIAAQRQREARLEAERREREWRRQEDARRQEEERRQADAERQRRAEARQREEETRRREEEARRQAEAQRRAEEERRRAEEERAREQRRRMCLATRSGSRTSCVEARERAGAQGSDRVLKNKCNYPVAVWYGRARGDLSNLIHLGPYGTGTTSWSTDRRFVYAACYHAGGVTYRDGSCVVSSWACSGVD